MNNKNFKSWLNSPSKSLIMGILNVTPDSFSDGGQFTRVHQAADFALKMINDGADIIDIGGESTRPGADPVPFEEELRRIKPVIKTIRKQTDCLISIDTYKASVAEVALDLGADIINDISAGNLDDKMLDVVVDLNVPYIMMHMQGTPKNMQNKPNYNDVNTDVFSFFEERINLLKQKGFEKIIIDPGFGFGKTLKHNYELLSGLHELKS